MSRIDTINQAAKYRLIPLHELRDNGVLWDSYIKMRELQEELHGHGNDPHAIENEAEGI